MIEVLHHAINFGVTFLDTSNVYGPFTNEILIGKALKEGGLREREFKLLRNLDSEWSMEILRCVVIRSMSDQLVNFIGTRNSPLSSLIHCRFSSILSCHVPRPISGSYLCLSILNRSVFDSYLYVEIATLINLPKLI